MQLAQETHLRSEITMLLILLLALAALQIVTADQITGKCSAFWKLSYYHLKAGYFEEFLCLFYGLIQDYFVGYLKMSNEGTC